MKFGLAANIKYILPAFYAHKRILELFREYTLTLIYMDYETDIQILGNNAVICQWTMIIFPNFIQHHEVNQSMIPIPI